MATTAPKKRKFSSICTVAIFVGSEKIQFIVHQDQLCEISTFFKAAFSSQYKESSEKTIELPEDDVDTVELFVQWLYEHRCNLWTVPIDDGGEYLMQPIRLLVFADKYDIPSFKIYILKKILAHAKEGASIIPSAAVVQYAYSKTCGGSGIRRMIAEWHTRIPMKWFQRQSSRDWLLRNPEVAVDLLTALSTAPELDQRPALFKYCKPAHYMDAQVDDSSDESNSDDSSSDDSSSDGSSSDESGSIHQ